VGGEGLPQGKPIVEVGMFTISDAWIDSHRSDRGGWTRTQVEALGESRPLKAGRRALPQTWTFSGSTGATDADGTHFACNEGDRILLFCRNERRVLCRTHAREVMWQLDPRDQTP